MWHFTVLELLPDVIAIFSEGHSEGHYNSNFWNGEDVMGIFFNEFNRYKKKSDSGQFFTPDHITSFMYRLIEIDKDDRVLDAACSSGTEVISPITNNAPYPISLPGLCFLFWCVLSRSAVAQTINPRYDLLHADFFRIICYFCHSCLIADGSFYDSTGLLQCGCNSVLTVNTGHSINVYFLMFHFVSD